MKWSLKQLSTVLAYLALTPAAVYASENSAIAPKDSAVVKLTAETFNSFIKENPLVLLEFFAPWCGHCKNLGPEFSAAADELLEKDIRLAQVDCTEERELCQEFGVSGYPTLKVFKEDIEATDYKGGRTSDSIITYMVKLAQPPVIFAKTESEVDDILNNSRNAVMIQIETKGHNNETFHKIAKQLDDKITFVSIEKPVGKFAKSKANYLVVRPNDEDVSEFDGDLNETTLEEFAVVQAKPLFGVIDGSTFQEYMSSALPLAYYFHETPEERELVADLMTKLAKKYRGEINFVSIDASTFGRHALNLNMEENFPLFAIHNITSNLKYGLPSSTSLNKEIEDFVAKFQKGELEPIVKSEEVPTLEELAESPVHKIVGKTHDDLIKSGKKVLVMYHAPWCGHCKRLHPIYEELLSVINSDEKAKDNYIIGNLDGTVNDVNVDITGYPTLILYEGEKEPVIFKGPRDLENLAEFIGYDLSNNSATIDEDTEDASHDEL